MIPAKAAWLIRFLPACLCFSAFVVVASPLPEHASRMNDDLRQKILPYWLSTTTDEENGGYVLADGLKGRGVAMEKQLSSQARMIWAFSFAHQKGFGDARHDYRSAAAKGYRFLMAHFYDSENGGFVWRTDLQGKVTNDRKVFYGQALVLNALVEYHRASGEKEPLQKALELYDLIQTRAHDATNKGWNEHFRRDWTPISQSERFAEIGLPGLKSASGHLHWMEALGGLFAVTHEARVGTSLSEALEINSTYFFPKDPAQSVMFRQANWSAVPRQGVSLSYGHNLQFARLMIRTEKILGRRPSWNHFGAHLRHALAYGFDHDRGGLYERGSGEAPATKTDKVWWAQAEMMEALTMALEHRPNIGHAEALAKLLHFVAAYQTDPKDGVWLDRVAEDGKPKNTAKAHTWKAADRDLEAMVKFVEVFSPKKK